MDVTRTSVITADMPQDEALKLARALGRVLAAMDRLEPGARTRLVNTGTVDTLLAFKTSLYLAIPEEDPCTPAG